MQSPHRKGPCPKQDLNRGPFMWGDSANHHTSKPSPTPTPTPYLSSCFSILRTQAQTSGAHTWMSLHWSPYFQPLLQHTWKFVTFDSPFSWYLFSGIFNFVCLFLITVTVLNALKTKQLYIHCISKPFSQIPWTVFYCNLILLCGLKVFHVDYSPALACPALPCGFISEDLHSGSLPAALVFIWQTSKWLQIRKW